MTDTRNLFSELRSNWKEGGKIALETGDGRSFTYTGIIELSARLAHVLTASGVKPGDRVAAQVEKSAEALFLYLACLRVGAVYLPLNTAYTLAELDYFLRDAEPALLVCDPEKAQACEALCREAGVPKCLTLGHKGDGSLMTLAASKAAHSKMCTRGSDDLAAILYTSGTTGRSKGAMLTTAICRPTPLRSSRHGASLRTTCFSMPCRFFTPTGYSWPATWRSCPARA